MIKKQMRKLPLWQQFTVLLVFALIFYYFSLKGEESTIHERVSLNSCIDGDTARFVIQGKVEKVRFIAIDTPELNTNDFYAKEAADFTCSTLQQADTISIELDPKSDSRDKYERIIAWVYVDEILLKELIVKDGYGKVHYIYDDYLYVNKLRSLESKAKQVKKGIWN